MIRFGILGAGNIAKRFAMSLAHSPQGVLVAASCRTQEKADSFLSMVPCADNARGFGSHEALLRDPNVDAIYLALPHALHHEWALAALRAGKPVLCEKPACVSAHEMAEVAELAQHQTLLFMEAMKPRFLAAYPKIMEAVREISPITNIEASLCNDMIEAVGRSGSYHMSPGPGAGVLLDCGTYCASWIEDLCPGIPKLVSVDAETQNGIDIYVNALFDHDGVTARLECAFDRAKPRTCLIEGAHGSVLVQELHRPTSALVTYKDGSQAHIDAPYEVDDLYGEIAHFIELVESGVTESPIMPYADSLHCALILDSIRSAL